MNSAAERIDIRAAMDNEDTRDAMLEGSSGGPVAQKIGVSLQARR